MTVLLSTQEAIFRDAGLVTPHGGVLVDRTGTAETHARLQEITANLPGIEVDARTLADIECIATGVYSPLTGFMVERDYCQVIDTMRLANGTVWPVPVVLTTTHDIAAETKTGDVVALVADGQPVAVMTITDMFRRDKEREALNVYRTTDRAHPGVADMYASGDICLGGEISLVQPIVHNEFARYRLTPADTRAEFARRGWRTVAAFQTRNPIHRAHEYLQKVALEIVDGLFVNPLVGTTKNDDVPAEVRMRTYEVVLDAYYPPARTILGVFPASMRYAGPREAVMHAIARQNFGCTHFIVGRDHAGVGNYYGTYDAQTIFDEFTAEEIGITPLKFEHGHYCRDCGQLVTSKTCPHSQESWVHLSGTKVREMLCRGEMPPPEFTRPEVAKILIEAYSNAG